MRFVRISLQVTAMILCLAMMANAGAIKGSHQVELRLGMFNQVSDVQTRIYPERISTSFETNGWAGGLTYSYWMSDNTAVSIQLGSIISEYETTMLDRRFSSEMANVIPILVGVKHCFGRYTEETYVRPFASLAVGPYFGREAAANFARGISAEARNETAFGGRVGGGVDFLIGSRFVTGINAGYHWTSDFSKTIGGSDNYAGPEFGVSFGLRFGGDR